MKAYLAGPMRGLPAYNFPAFFEAEKVLVEAGWKVFNPARADIERCGIGAGGSPQAWGEYLLSYPENFDLREALAEDFAYITREADVVVFLPGYEKSRGAKAERAAAEALGLPLLYFHPTEGVIALSAYEDEFSGPGLHEMEAQETIPTPGLDALLAEEPAWGPGEVRTTSKTGGQKGSKPERYDLIPWEAMDEVARVYGFGAQKYAAHNWRRKYEWGKSIAALIRHVAAFVKGEMHDPETGLHPLAHAVFHCLALIVWTQEDGAFSEFDDRYHPGMFTPAEGEGQ